MKTGSLQFVCVLSMKYFSLVTSQSYFTYIYFCFQIEIGGKKKRIGTETRRNDKIDNLFAFTT